MINDFEVGSWIRTPDNEIVQILEFDTVNGIKNKLSNESTCFNGYLKACVLWKPEEGEWCWFWSKNFTQKQLLPYKSYFKGDYKTKEQGIGLFNKKLCYIDYFDYCEPFIGKLPTDYKIKN